jgi:hypothetical protein
MKISLLVLLFFAIRLFGAQAADQTPPALLPQTQLKEACFRLVEKPLDPASLHVLLDYTRSTSGIPTLKSRAMAAYALSSLMNGETNLFERAQRSHAASFPADRALINVRLEACYRPCDTCGGAGYLEHDITCSQCKGAGKCEKCKGTGRWQTESAVDTRISRVRKHASVMDCYKCAGSGTCPDCNGLKVYRTKCELCLGAGCFFQRPRALSENLQTLLSVMITSIQSEESLLERIRQAKAETLIDLRIRSFEKLLRECGNRPELAEIERLLLADQVTVKRERENTAARAQQIEQDISVMRALRDSDNASAAIGTLKEYLSNNPGSPHQLEIQSIINECEVKLTKKREMTMYLRIGGGLLILLFGLSCIHINYFKYTMLPSYTAGATRRKPDSNQFTDPLALTAKESRDRVKAKTANISLDS